MRFFKMNRLPITVENVTLLIGQMRRYLSPGTVKNYFGFIKPFLSDPSKAAITEYKLGLRSLGRAVDLAHADHETEHATDVSDDEVRRIICMLPVGYSCASLLIAAAGARVKDLTWLRAKQVTMTESGFEIIRFVSKGSRKRSDRAFVGVPYRVAWLRPESSIKEWWSRFPPTKRPFKSLNVSVLNKAIRIAAGRTDISSYSLRRAFLRRVLQYVNFDFEKAMKFTGHRSVRALKAHYDPRLDPFQTSWPT
jgi:integrase